MRHLNLAEVLEIHRLVLAQSGGAAGIRDWGALESALAQPLMTFGGQELYPTLAEKAAALCFSLVGNLPSWMATNGWAMPPWRSSFY
jgi:death-on-curing protein